MSSHDVVDPVAAVGGVKNHSPLKGPEGASQSTGNSQNNNKYLFQTNYILEVMKYTNIAMEHQASIVALRGEVAALGTKIASDLATISQFISKIQSEAHSGGQESAKINGNWYASPDSYSGLAKDFYHMDEANAGTFGSDSSSGCVSDSYATMMKSFIAAVKDLYFSSPTGVGPTVKDLTTIDNPADSSKNFNMMDYFKKIQGSYSKYSCGTSQGVISTNPSDHPSLMQQYMYAKAKLVVNTSTTPDLNNANGDISKLVNFDPSSDGFDSDLGPFMQVLDSLDIQTSVASEGHSAWTHSKTDNILSMILNGQLNNTYNGGTPGGKGDVGQIDPGLYAAFSYMAYNYIWTKNPNLDANNQSASNVPNAPVNIGQDKKGGWNYNPFKGNAQGDPLSAMYANVTSCQSNFSAAGSATGTSFQQDVNSVQQVNGAAGKMIDGFSQGQETLVRNFKS